MGGHGAESGVSRERESGQTAKAEIVTVDLYEVVLELTRELVAAKGGSEEGVPRGVSLRVKDVDDLALELVVGDSTGEFRLDGGVELGVNGGGVLRDDEALDLGEDGIVGDPGAVQGHAPSGDGSGGLESIATSGAEGEDERGGKLHLWMLI